MENNIIFLIYGDKLPPKKHIEKIMKKYQYYYQIERDNQYFNEADFYNIIIEERYTGIEPRKGLFNSIIPVRKSYLSKFINIFNTLNCNLCLCKENHEHPIAVFHGKEFEGYCYYFYQEEKKIMFLEDYGLEENKMNIGDLYEKVLQMPDIDMNDEESLKRVDWNKFLPVNERFCVEDLEWYRQTPHEMRWLIVDAKRNTNKAFHQWVKKLMQFEPLKKANGSA